MRARAAPIDVARAAGPRRGPSRAGTSCCRRPLGGCRAATVLLCAKGRLGRAGVCRGRPRDRLARRASSCGTGDAGVTGVRRRLRPRAGRVLRLADTELPHRSPFRWMRAPGDANFGPPARRWCSPRLAVRFSTRASGRLRRLGHWMATARRARHPGGIRRSGRPAVVTFFGLPERIWRMSARRRSGAAGRGP